MSHHAARPICGFAVLVCFRCPNKTCKKEANVTQAMWSKAVARLRSILWLRLCKDSEQPLGGPGKVVCIDEAFICKKRRSRGGFQGRSTSGTKQIILGMIELDLETRKATGRIFLSTIPDRSQKTLRKHIQKQVLPGALIFTEWLKKLCFSAKKDFQLRAPLCQPQGPRILSQGAHFW